MKVGDIVTRNSYHNDLKFVVVDISKTKVLLSGLEYRLLVDAAISDLISSTLISEATELKSIQHCMINNDFTKDFISDYALLKEHCFVKTLHIDSNNYYLKECMSHYKDMGIPAIGFSIKEEKQPEKIFNLLTKYRPNILVITGHDSLNQTKITSKDINSYLYSKYFVRTVEIARNYNRSLDELVIIAGGCKSHYEALINAGANFASSPDRVLINVTEPVTIACKLASTSIKQMVSMDHIVDELPSGISGFGGIETRGQCRLIKPIF